MENAAEVGEWGVAHVGVSFEAGMSPRLENIGYIDSSIGLANAFAARQDSQEKRDLRTYTWRGGAQRKRVVCAELNDTRRLKGPRKPSKLEHVGVGGREVLVEWNTDGGGTCLRAKRPFVFPFILHERPSTRYQPDRGREGEEENKVDFHDSFFLLAAGAPLPVGMCVG